MCVRVRAACGTPTPIPHQSKPPHAARSSLALSLVNIQRAKKTTHGARYRKKHTRPAHEEPDTPRAIGMGQKASKKEEEKTRTAHWERIGESKYNGWWWWEGHVVKRPPHHHDKTLDLFQSKAMCVLRVCATHKARIFSLFGLSLSLSLSLAIINSERERGGGGGGGRN